MRAHWMLFYSAEDFFVIIYYWVLLRWL